jgi:hypothetical protein
LKKLRAALKAFELDPPANRTAALIDFIQSVYELPTATTEHSTKASSGLRDIVVAHVAAYLPKLQADPEFSAYIKEGGDFVADLFIVLAGVKRTHH